MSLKEEGERLGMIQERVRRKFNPDYPRNATPKLHMLHGRVSGGVRSQALRFKPKEIQKALISLVK